MVKEKLVNDDVFAILEQLCAMEFGEHNILIYNELDSFREIYSQHIKKRLAANEIVLMLPHHENIDCVKNVLKEIEIDVEKHRGRLARNHGFCQRVLRFRHENFFSFLKILRQRVKDMNKSGLSVVVDMGSFYHLGKIGEMIGYEKSIPAKSYTTSSLLCSYHIKDFSRLEDDQKQLLLDHHYRNLLVKNTNQS